MTEYDRARWDERYSGALAPESPAPPAVFGAHLEEFPRAGAALDLACGQGATAVWLAGRGLDVLGLDVSPVAVARAAALAERSGVAQRCRISVHDLDHGLPAGPPAAVILCARFWDARLGATIIQRLAPGGVLAITALTTGRFAAAPDEFPAAFGALAILASGTADGQHWLLARR